MTIEIVRFPIKNGDFGSYVSLPEGNGTIMEMYSDHSGEPNPQFWGSNGVI